MSWRSSVAGSCCRCVSQLGSMRQAAVLAEASDDWLNGTKRNANAYAPEQEDRAIQGCAGASRRRALAPGSDVAVGLFPRTVSRLAMGKGRLGIDLLPGWRVRTTTTYRNPIPE